METHSVGSSLDTQPAALLLSTQQPPSLQALLSLRECVSLTHSLLTSWSIGGLRCSPLFEVILLL